MDLNLLSANVNRLLTNIWAVISFLKEFAVDDAKDVSITYINADGSESVETFPNIAKMENSFTIQQMKTVELGNVSVGQNVNTLLSTITLQNRKPNTHLICMVSATGNNLDSDSDPAHGLHILQPYGVSGQRLISQLAPSVDLGSYWQMPIAGMIKIEDSSITSIPLYTHSYDIDGAGMTYLNLTFTVMEVLND